MTLPVGPTKPALDASHFPDRAHAFVWRNWTLVEPKCLAAVLDTSIDNVLRMARSMGLPQGRQVCTRMSQRGQMTLLRRNWHLLPYKQLLVLLDMNVEELSFYLREDDVAFVKLGNVKPACEPVRYHEPDQAARSRAAQIKQTVDRYFGDLSKHSEQPRFSFVDQWSRDDASVTDKRAALRIDDGLRCLYSYFGVFGDPLIDPSSDPYPDGMLAELAKMGINGVWMHVVLRQLAPGGEYFPEFGQGHERRLENLRRMVERVRKFGIGIYLYLNEPRAMPSSFYDGRAESKGVVEDDYAAMCSSCPQVRQWMTDATAHIFREVPDLAGVFTITGTENLTFCYSHGNGEQCPRCGPRGEAEVTAQVNAAITTGVHRGNPNARVIIWDWGWNGHGDAPETIARLPESAWFMSVSEWSLPIERGGVASQVGEHAISAVGPGPRARRHWSLARQRGLKSVANVHVNTTCELLSVPFLPVMDLVAQHAVNLAQEQLDGVIMSWSMGGYPSPNVEIFSLLFDQPGANVDDVLNSVARHRYGEQAVEHARKAWTLFSQGFAEFPYHIDVIYYAPHSIAPANLLYWKPTGYQATMVGIPYDDLKRWQGPYPPENLAGQFDLVAAGWRKGLVHFEQAVAAADASGRSSAIADLRVAQAAGIHFASAANQVRFVTIRDQLHAFEHGADHQETLSHALRMIIEREIELAQQLYNLALADARLGFEAACHYFYVPLDLVEKVLNCEDIRNTMDGRVRK